MSVLAASSVTAMVAATSAQEDLPNWFVCVMGVGTVFIGLVCLIVLCSVMSAVYRKFSHHSAPVAEPVAAAAPAPGAGSAEIPNRQQFVAAVSAVIAEEMGTDVSKLRILSIKKI